MHLEYHELFSNVQKTIDKNSYTLMINGLDKGMSLPNKTIKADEICKLIDPDTGMFITEMRFDDWLFKIEKIEVDVSTKKVIITVNK